MSTVEFRLPDVGEGIDGADLLEWLVSPGEEVREDQPIAAVETDKATVEIPAPASGLLAELRFDPGQRVQVGEVIAVIQTDATMSSSPEGPQAANAAHAAPPTTAQTAGDAAVGRRADGPTTSPSSSPPSALAVSHRPPPASPSTRRYARELGVDLTTVTGTGPAGRIEREDVDRVRDGDEAPTREPTAGPPPHSSARGPRGVQDEVVPLRGVRRTLAHRLTAAWQDVPRIIDYREVDATALLRTRAKLRDAARARGDERLARGLTAIPLLTKIACRAIADHPYVNSSIDMDNERITLHGRCHVALATATPDGLMAPVVTDAQDRSVGELALASMELNEAAQARTLSPDQLTGGTFTVNNFGGLGIWLGTPIVVPPQVVNMGIGRIDERAVVLDGEIVARPILPLSVSADHRVLDGHTLAAFVSRVVELIEDPSLLLEDAI